MPINRKKQKKAGNVPAQTQPDRVAQSKSWAPNLYLYTAALTFDALGMHLVTVKHNGEVKILRELARWNNLRPDVLLEDLVIWLGLVSDLYILDSETGLTATQKKAKLELVEGLFKSAKTSWFRVQILRLKQPNLSPVSGEQQAVKQAVYGHGFKLLTSILRVESEGAMVCREMQRHENPELKKL
jgi:hypothetical protein